MGRYVDSPAFWFALILSAYFLDFLIMIGCVFARVDVFEWGKVIIVIMFAPMALILLSFILCRIARGDW